MTILNPLPPSPEFEALIAKALAAAPLPAVKITLRRGWTAPSETAQDKPCA